MNTVLAAAGHHVVWVVHRGHPLIFLAMLGVIFVLLMTVIILAVLHFGKK